MLTSACELHIILLVCLRFDLNFAYDATTFSRLNITFVTIALVVLCLPVLTRQNNLNFSYWKFYWARERCYNMSDTFNYYWVAAYTNVSQKFSL